MPPEGRQDSRCGLIVGILSDSHGDHLMVRKVVSLFDSLDVAHIIHCGDVCGTDVFDELVGRPLTFVWGNCDVASDATLAYLDGVGLAPPNRIPTILELDAKRFAVFHGHEREFQPAVHTLDVDYLLHGHTHVARDERINGKRIINPGALHRADPKTVATLDTATDKLTFHEMGGE